MTETSIIEALKEGGKIPEMLNSLRVHHMQQEAFRELLTKNIQNPLFKDKGRAKTFFDNYVKCAVYIGVVATRGLLEFFDLGADSGDPPTLKVKKSVRNDDIRISGIMDDAHRVVLTELVLTELNNKEKQALAEICVLANKTIAHITDVYKSIESNYHNFHSAVNSIERLLQKFVYTQELQEKYGIKMPERFYKFNQGT